MLGLSKDVEIKSNQSIDFTKGGERKKVDKNKPKKICKGCTAARCLNGNDRRGNNGK